MNQKDVTQFNQAKQALLFHDGFRLPINGTFTDKGTLPAGSTWAMSPIPPRCLGGSCHEVSSTKPFCKPCPLPVMNKDGVARDCTTCDNTPEPAFPPPCDEKAHGACSGNEASSSVVDFLKIPATLKPGEYVLQWRLDCEATAQVRRLRCAFSALALMMICLLSLSCAAGLDELRRRRGGGVKKGPLRFAC